MRVDLTSPIISFKRHGHLDSAAVHTLDAYDSDGRDADKPTGGVRLAAARCWALLLTRIFKCLPLRCPKCGEPIRIIAFVLDPTVIERILGHMESFHDPAKAMR